MTPDLIVTSSQTDFLSVLTDDRIIWQKECEFALQALNDNSYLWAAAEKNPRSLQAAIMNVAAIGVTLNPLRKHAYLVPRKLNGDLRVCLDISYQGLLDLAIAEGSILWGQAKCVHEKDVYKNTGIDSKPVHEYSAFRDRGDMIGVFCSVKTPAGDYLTEEMDMATLDRIRSASKAENGPWKNWFEQMARKAVIKRASHYWPNLGNRFERAVEVLNEEEGNEPIIEKDITTQSQTLNGMLEDEGADFRIDGRRLDEMISEADSEERLNDLRASIRDMPAGDEQARLKGLWVKRRDQLRGDDAGS